MNGELPDAQAGFRKGRGARDQIANRCWNIEKARESQKTTSISASLTMLRPLTVWITTNWKILKEMGIPDHLTLPGTTDWFPIGKGVCQGLYCHPAYLSYMQSTSFEMLGCMNHKLESRLLGEVSTTSDYADDTILIAESEEPLDEGERGE